MNNSMEPGRLLVPRKRLIEEVSGAVRLFGPGHVGMLTLTFRDEVLDMAEAARRFDSLNSNWLGARFEQWASVKHRDKRGCVHFHFCVVTRFDMSGVNYAEFRQRNYASAPDALRDEWRALRATLPGYGFGRHELLPMYGSGFSFGRYLGRYLGHNMSGRRKLADRGTRLITYSKTWRRCVAGPVCSVFRGDQVSLRIDEFIRRGWWRNQYDLETDLGGAWRFKLRRALYCPGGQFEEMLDYVQKGLAFVGGGSELFLMEEFFLISREERSVPGLSGESGAD